VRTGIGNVTADVVGGGGVCRLHTRLDPQELGVQPRLFDFEAARSARDR
jgi:hypothetical protein